MDWFPVPWSGTMYYQQTREKILFHELEMEPALPATGNVTWLEHASPASLDAVYWATVHQDSWFEVQQFVLGAAGKAVHSFSSAPAMEHTMDFRLILRSASGPLQLSLSSQKQPLLHARLVLHKVRVAKLGAPMGWKKAFPDIPLDIIESVLQEVNRRSNDHNTKSAMLDLPAELHLRVLSFLCSVRSHAFTLQSADPWKLLQAGTGVDGSQNEGNGRSRAQVVPLLKYAEVCKWWAVTSTTNSTIWAPFLGEMGHHLKLEGKHMPTLHLVQDAAAVKGSASCRDVFVLACLEACGSAASGHNTRAHHNRLAHPSAQLSLGLHRMSYLVSPTLEISQEAFQWGGYYGFRAGEVFFRGQVLGTLFMGFGGLAMGIVMGSCCLVEGAGHGLDVMLAHAAQAAREAPSAIFGPGSTDHVDRVKSHDHRKSLFWGIGSGMNSLASECLDAMVGLVREPINGAWEREAIGCMQGVARGVSGLVMKPISGTFDLAGNVLDGACNSVEQVRRGIIFAEAGKEIKETYEMIMGIEQTP